MTNRPPPTFIIGPPRSGTTLVADLLAVHPEIAMRGEEFHCFHHNLVQFGQRHPQDDYRLTAWHFSDDLRRRYQAAIDDVLAETGGDVFALKISTLSQQVDFICSLFPDARFIQMIRDGRDVACSMDDLRVALSSSGDGERLLGPAADPLGLSFACAFGTDGERGILNAAASWFFHIASSYLDLGFAAGALSAGTLREPSYRSS